MESPVDVLPPPRGVVSAGQKLTVKIAESVNAAHNLAHGNKLKTSIALALGRKPAPHLVVRDQLIRLTLQNREQIMEDRFLASTLEIVLDLRLNHRVAQLIGDLPVGRCLLFRPQSLDRGTRL